MSAVGKLFDTKLDTKQLVNLSVDELNKMAVQYGRVGLFKKSKLLFNMTINKDKNYKRAYYNLIILYRVTKEYKKALEVFDNINTKFGKDFRAYFLVSKVYFDLQDYKKANNYYQQSIKNDSRLKNAYYQSAISQKNTKSYQYDNDWIE